MNTATESIGLVLPVAAPAEDRSTGFYAPALDGLRCFAVCSVFFEHFSATLVHFAEWGQWGVRLFFVLSGFLITRLLLETRVRIEAGRQSFGRALKTFFIRRVFRLWPVYYLCLAAAYILNLDVTRDTIWWHVLMASNWYVFHSQSWPGIISHFWTLAVEQQFYLFWPFVILFCRKRWLDLVLLAVLTAGPLARETLLFIGGTPLNVIYTPLPCCLDFFAVGGGIAWGHKSGWLARVTTTLRLRLLLVPFLGWLVYGSILKYAGYPLPPHWPVYDPLIQALGFGATIVYLLHRPDGLASRCLSLSPFVYVGQISYGLYIIHNFMHWFAPGLLFHTLGIRYMPNELAHVAYYIILTTVIAAISHQFFEDPVRRWGRHLA